MTQIYDAIQEGAGRDPRAHVSGNDGAGVGAMPKTILDASGASAPVPYIAIDPQTGKPAGAPK